MRTMAEMSSMFAAISPDMDVEKAQSGLVSIMKAYKIEADDVLDSILSKVNIIGNTAATSNGEIVEMLKRSSSAMSAANTSLEETIALETAAFEIVQDSSKIGNAMKSISMRLRGYDEQTEEFVGGVEKLSGEVANLTKTASTPGGISLFTDESKNTYKSIYQIFKEISEIWNDLTDKQQAALQETIGSKYHGNTFAAIMSNFEAADKALNIMKDSAGNAEAEMEVIRDSAEYLLNQLKETFTSISQNAISRDDLKNLIKLGTSLLEIVNGIVSGIGAIPTLLGTIFGIMATKSRAFLGVNKDTGKFSLFGVDLEKGWFGNLKAGRKEIIATRNLVNQLRTSFDGAAISGEMLNKVNASSSVALRTLVSDFNKGTISSAEFTAGLNKISSGLKTANSGVTAFKNGIKTLGVGIANMAVSMAVFWAISEAISAIVKAVDDAKHAVENLTKSAKENTDTAKSSKTEIERLNDELKTTKKRIAELNRIKLTRGLTLFEEDEYNSLKKYNDELERRIKLETAEMELALQKANNEAKEGIEKARKNWIGRPLTYKDQAYYFDNNGRHLGIKDEDIKDVPSSEIAKAKSEQELLIIFYKEMLDKLKRLQDEQSKLSPGDEFEKKGKEIEEFQEHLNSMESALMDSMSTVYQWESSLNPNDPANKETLEYLEKLVYDYEVLQGTIETTITGIFESARFTTVHDALQELARTGELTTEKFLELDDTDVDGIEDFRNELAAIGKTDAEEIVKSIIFYVKELDKKAKNGGNSLGDYTEALEELTDAVDDAVSKQNKLVDAFKKTRLGAKLTAEEIYELIKEMPKIASYISPSSDGFSISDKGFAAVSQLNKEELQKKIEKDIKDTKEQIKLTKKREELEKVIASSENEFNAILPQGDTVITPEQYSEIEKKIDELNKLRNEYKEVCGKCDDLSKSSADLAAEEKAFQSILQYVNEEFDEQKAILDGLKEAYDAVKDEIDGYNQNISAVDDALKTLAEGEFLTYDQMNELIALNHELQDSFEPQENGRYSIAVEELEKLREQSYKTRNDYIDDRIAEANAKIDSAEAIIRANETIIRSKNEVITAAEKAAANEAKNDAYKQIAELNKIIDMLEGLRNEITTEDDSKTTEEKLQETLDYYNTIIDAVEIMKNKYTDAIDKEIDALNDGKNALKETNDERQRELDLIEARNNLENAKKRRVYVYTEGEGFKQVQDKSAVKEAEEEYSDAITAVQEAEIDKAIAEKEKQKEALEDNVEDIVNSVQNIEDALTVGKAMDALGLTDESELLDLPDDVKEGIITELADATLQKDIEENKDNEKYSEITLDTLLEKLGSTKRVSDIDPAVFENIQRTAYDSALNGFVDALKTSAQNMVNNVSYNNAPVINASFVINDANDPQAVADTVNKEIGNLLRQYCNSIK